MVGDDKGAVSLIAVGCGQLSQEVKLRSWLWAAAADCFKRLHPHLHKKWVAICFSSSLA